MLKRAICALIATTLCGAVCAASAEADLAPVLQAEARGSKPIVDTTGRSYYMVDLVEDAQLAFSDSRSVRGQDRFHERHSRRARNMVEWYEQTYGFEYEEMTSYVGNSFSAHLTEGQVRRLQEDPYVVAISEVETGEFSGPPWYDTTISTSVSPYYETHPWGRNAVNGKQSTNSRRVYVLDAGVGYHADLQNVVSRVNASCGTNNMGCDGRSPVGCYPHATHVAGIIGAAYRNKGVAGVNAGAKILSVSFLTDTAYPTTCARPQDQYGNKFFNSASVATAMDWVKWDIILNSRTAAGIVNLSWNSTAFKPGETLQLKMASLAKPNYSGGYVYPGAFITHSAGNQFQSACNVAFGYTGGVPLSSDGIMVVGAIDSSGAPVVRPSSGYGFVNMPYAGNEYGSNYGSCVEVWAPGKSLLSTWGPMVGFSSTDSSTWQMQSVTYDNYVPLSGTSMAAPHIAAVAAYLAETRGLVSPGEIETAVRSLFYQTGRVDSAGLPVNLVRLP